MIYFRKVEETDFKKLYYWLNIPHVKKFWDSNDNFTFEEISRKYSKRIKEPKIGLYIFSVDDVDIGFIQTYFIDELSSFMISGIAKGIDLYIGEPDFVYKGYGKQIIMQFVNDYIFIEKQIEFVVIDPEVRNTSAIKAYKKAGFRHTNTAFNKYEKAMTYYMVLSRDEFFCNY